MRRFDLTPLLRSSVGFDDLFRLTDSLTGLEQEGGFPPYNIERMSDDDYPSKWRWPGSRPTNWMSRCRKTR